MSQWGCRTRLRGEGRFRLEGGATAGAVCTSLMASAHYCWVIVLALYAQEEESVTEACRTPSCNCSHDAVGRPWDHAVRECYGLLNHEGMISAGSLWERRAWRNSCWSRNYSRRDATLQLQPTATSEMYELKSTVHLMTSRIVVKEAARGDPTMRTGSLNRADREVLITYSEVEYISIETTYLSAPVKKGVHVDALPGFECPEGLRIW